LRVGDGGGEGDALERGGEAGQAGEREGEQVAALAGGEGVDLVDHHAPETGEQRIAFRVAEEQRERFGGGQEDVGRAGALAGLAVGRGIAGAGLNADGEAHFLDRSQQVTLDVMGEGLERGDVERVQAVGGRRAGGGAEIREGGQKSGEGLARAGIGDEQRVAAGAGGGEHFRLVAAQAPAPAGEPGGDLRRWRGFGHGADIGAQPARCNGAATALQRTASPPHPRRDGWPVRHVP